MKFLSLIFLLTQFSLYHCEEEPEEKQICDEQCEQMIKQRNENNKKFNDTLKQTLKEMNLENATKLTIEQFRTVFMKLFSLGKSETNYKEEDDKEFRNHIFNNLVPEGSDGIEVDNIFKCFEPKVIIRSLKKVELSLGKYNKIEFFSENIRKTLKDMEEEKKQKKEEKNSDL